MKLKILGDDWEIGWGKVENKTFAYTDIRIKEIVFSKRMNNDNKEFLNTIIHEINHAYYSYVPILSCNLSNDQWEELACEMIAKYGIDIIKQSRYVYKKLRPSKKTP